MSNKQLDLPMGIMLTKDSFQIRQVFLHRDHQTELHRQTEHRHQTELEPFPPNEQHVRLDELKALVQVNIGCT